MPDGQDPQQGCWHSSANALTHLPHPTPPPPPPTVPSLCCATPDNFPEGVAVFLAAQKSHAIGVSLAVAIALHNIPEGVAVALPVYFATGSRARGFRMAALSGLAEPFAVVVLALFFPAALPKQLVDAMLAGVGGIMAFLAFHELLPLAIQHAGKNAAVGSLFAGLALMSANLHLLNTYVLQGMH
jgi:ZIP family zinc transporter